MTELWFDVVTALSLGARERQEDAVVVDFPIGAPVGFAVLSDGMGGHASGDMASGIVATEMFSGLKLLAGDPAQMEQAIGAVLCDAAKEANVCIQLFEGQNPEAQGMGATLVAPVVFENRLYWISVGDSPLYLFRGGKLYRLNEDHSYAAQIDSLHARGIIPLEEAQNHPDRSALVSVLAGGEIAKIDCRTEPMMLETGDIVLAASDGIHTLTDAQIVDVLAESRAHSSAQITHNLMNAITVAGCPDQDNLSLCVIKARPSFAANATTESPASTALEAEPADLPKVTETGTVVKLDRDTQGGSVHTVFSLIRKVSK